MKRTTVEFENKRACPHWNELTGVCMHKDWTFVGQCDFGDVRQDHCPVPYVSEIDDKSEGKGVKL